MCTRSIQVDVKLFGFANEVPASHVSLELLGDVTLRDVLENLAVRCGSRLGERLLGKDGRLPEDIKLVIDAEVIDRLDHNIENDTTVFVISQFSGG
ncbi:MAG: MoaD/ThiS family protein [Chloroflexi bacterium]|nr:MoaD/ThiS family protein [Chloroflexota bacterium]